MSKQSDAQHLHQYNNIWNYLNTIDTVALREAQYTRSHIDEGLERLSIRQAAGFDDSKDYIGFEHQRTRDHFDHVLYNQGSNTGAKRLESQYLSLHFPAINARRGAIEPKHERTFEWIFKRSSERMPKDPNFVEWLHGDGGLYWISGKAGSGKSTLMQYITESPRLRTELEKWSGVHQLSISSFFFWKSGTSLQNSTEGMLRSLVFQGLQQSPARQSEVLGPELARAIDPKHHAWTLKALESCLKRLLSRSQERFALFIDGLDEFTGDLVDILQLFDDVVNLSNIKICISSRPWAIFAEQLDKHPGLELQDLTNLDIASYVKDKLNLKRISAMGLQYWPDDLENGELMELIARTIVNKAEGVFIWVKTVLKSIQRGELELDSQQQLLDRLQYLDSDIESLYVQMLKGVEPRRRKQQTRLLKMAQCFEMEDCRRCRSDARFHVQYALFADATLEEAIALPFRPDTAPDKHSMFRAACSQIEASTKGLFETDQWWTNELQGDLNQTYIVATHQTVIEFLRGNRISDILLMKAEDGNYDGFTSIFIAELMMNKTCWQYWTDEAGYDQHDASFRATVRLLRRNIPLDHIAIAFLTEYNIMKSVFVSRRGAFCNEKGWPYEFEYEPAEVFLTDVLSAWQPKNGQTSHPERLKKCYDLRQAGGSGSIDHYPQASFICGIPSNTTTEYSKLKSDAECSSLIWQIATWNNDEIFGRNAVQKAALISRVHSMLEGDVDRSLRFLVYLLGKQIYFYLPWSQLAYVLAKRHPQSGLSERIYRRLRLSNHPQTPSNTLMLELCYFAPLWNGQESTQLSRNDRYRMFVDEGEMSPAERNRAYTKANMDRDLLIRRLHATPLELSPDHFTVAPCHTDGVLLTDEEVGYSTAKPSTGMCQRPWLEPLSLTHEQHQISLAISGICYLTDAMCTR